jgi:hypothetical protein
MASQTCAHPHLHISLSHLSKLTFTKRLLHLLCEANLFLVGFSLGKNMAKMFSVQKLIWKTSLMIHEMW